MSKVYPKAHCPTCDMEVSTHHLSWNNHLKMHAKKGELGPVSPVVDKPVDVEKVQAEPLLPNKIVAPSQIGDPKERALYERALQTQARFLAAPDSFSSPDESDEHMELRKLYAPDTIDKRDPMTGARLHKAPFHPYIGDRRTRDQDVNRGYVPVFDEHGRHVTTPGGDYLYKIDVRLFDAKQKAYSDENARILQQAEQSANGDRSTVDRSALGADEIPEPDTSTVKMEEATTTRGGRDGIS